MTDPEKLTLALATLKEAEILSRSPGVLVARLRLVELNELLTRRLAELGVPVTLPAGTPEEPT